MDCDRRSGQRRDLFNDATTLAVEIVDRLRGLKQPLAAVVLRGAALPAFLRDRRIVRPRGPRILIRIGQRALRQLTAAPDTSYDSLECARAVPRDYGKGKRISSGRRARLRIAFATL